MGLDFTHEADIGHHCPQWGYMGFGLFRERLAEAEGFVLRDMYGFTDLARRLTEPDHIGRDWEEITTPLKPLLDHSDCDGDLSPAECAQVAPRLREIVEQWPDDPEHHYDRVNGLALVDCMVVCQMFETKLEFC
jgi:hypothetical protein